MLSKPYRLFSDEQLMAAVVDGHPKAFHHLASRYQKRLYDFIWYWLLDRDLAQDVVQNVLLRLWQYPHVFNPEKGIKLSTWLFTLAKNNAIDLLRKQSKFSTIDDELESSIPHLEDTYQHEQSKNQLWKVIQKLPPQTRAILVLYFFEGWTHCAIAQQMSLSERQVRYSLQSAKKEIKTSLQHLKESLT